jgi:hypothetical protein
MTELKLTRKIGFSLQTGSKTTFNLEKAITAGSEEAINNRLGNLISKGY